LWGKKNLRGEKETTLGSITLCVAGGSYSISMLEGGDFWWGEASPTAAGK